jgi:8-oxo-dGTP pyrophosphatase MutT (NUDIX family)
MRQNRVMKNKQKVMVFIARPKASGYEWLARRNAPHPEHGGDRWYVVTGNVETGETELQAATREVQEETGITSVQHIAKLPIVNKYYSDAHPNIEFAEQAYLLVTTQHSPVVLNEESTESQWLSLSDFINTIWWPKDKSELKTILESATANT